MNKLLSIFLLACGMGILVAQEPAPSQGPDKGPPPMKGGKGGPPMGKRGPLSWKKLLELHDKDKDGLLSKEELSKGSNMWDRWQKGDEDKDGKLSEKEFDAYQKKLMERFRGGKGKEDRKKD